MKSHGPCDRITRAENSCPPSRWDKRRRWVLWHLRYFLAPKRRSCQSRVSHQTLETPGDCLCHSSGKILDFRETLVLAFPRPPAWRFSSASAIKSVGLPSYWDATVQFSALGQHLLRSSEHRSNIFLKASTMVVLLILFLGMLFQGT